MATGILPADTSVTNPHPRAKNHTRTRARYPPRVASYARARYPRACLARGYACVPPREAHRRPEEGERRPLAEWRPAARGGGRGGPLAEGRGRRERRWGRGALAAGLGGGGGWHWGVGKEREKP